MNQFVVDGTLGRDAEAVPTNGEMGLIKFSVANGDERRKGSDGQYTTVTSWFDVVFWVKDVQKYLVRLKKGVTVCVSGKLRQETWETDGQKRSKVSLVVNNWSDIHVVDRGTKATPEPEPEEEIGF